MLISTLYRGLTYCALPLAKCYLRKRARKQPDYLKHWDERFGWCRYPAPEKPRLWLHAVSVGETAAARTLIDAFLTENSEAEILLTCMTPTGRDTGAKIAERYPGRIVQCYLPYDNPRLMAKFSTNEARDGCRDGNGSLAQHDAGGRQAPHSRGACQRA